MSLGPCPVQLADAIVPISAFHHAVDGTARPTDARLRLLTGVVERLREGVVIADLAGTIVEVNPRFSEITGYAREEVIGMNPRLLKSGRHDDDFYAAMWAALLATGRWQGEIWNRRKSGEAYPQRLDIFVVHDDHGHPDHYIGIFTDISEFKAQQAHLEHLVHDDALTHLPNRTLLADRMKLALAHARRTGEVLAVCYLDMDHFKPINETYGHETGNRVLGQISQRLTHILRDGDTAARMGGDEFVLLLSGLSDAGECSRILERILDAVAQPIVIGNQQHSLSASIGATLFPQDNADADTLLRHADQALYAAKEAGRARFRIFDAEHDRRTRLLRDKLSRLEQALAAGELRLYYQPKVDMLHGQVIGAEALIRWQHPERGLLSPAELLPILENTPLDIAVGEWVIDEALRQMAEWRRQGLDLAISVNISAQHLAHRDFLGKLRAALARHAPTPAHRLEIEVLESILLSDIVYASSLIEDCQLLGIDFALDDFGTGYSSLTYLKRLSAGTLKIDQTFICDMLHDAGDLAIVEGIIGLAHAFHRRVIAEGVETVEHGISLLRLGCHLAQGYGIARPMAAAALPAWVAAWRPDPRWAGPNTPRRKVEDLRPDAGRQRRITARPATNYVLEKMLIKIPPVHQDTLTEEVFALFERQPEQRAIAVVRDGVPIGLISRYEMLDNMARPFRHELYGRKRCTRFMDAEPLIVNVQTPLLELSELLANAPPRHLVSGFIITDGSSYMGMGSVQDLVREITSMQMEAAKYANPLTQLPGNVPINAHIDKLLAAGEHAAICYCDLDNFKPFNDVYGYVEGDEVIRLTARILGEICDPELDFLGHIGGDDFVLVLRSEDWQARCERALEFFGQEVLGFFNSDDVERGGYVTENRKGAIEFHGLTTLSIGAMEVSPGMFSNHLAVAVATAEVKKKAKAIKGNSFYCNRRVYENDGQLPVAQSTGSTP